MTKTTCFEKQQWGCIYRLTAPNGKCYIGQTLDFKRRMTQHRRGGKAPKYAVHHAIKKYGWVNMKKEQLISDVPEEDLDHLEQAYIEVENTVAPHGYNLSTGGGRPSYSKATRRKMSKSKKKNNSIGKGTITFCKKERKWKVYSAENDERIYVGRFTSKQKSVDALSTFNVSREKMESDTRELQHGYVTFHKSMQKWHTCFTWTENGTQKKKFVGTYNSKDKALEALKTYVNSGTRLLSDTRPKRETGKGSIEFRHGKHRASVMKLNKSYTIGTFKTKIEAEDAIKIFLETGERSLKFKRTKEKGNISKRKSGRFCARYKQKNLGTFSTREEARSVIDEYLKQNA